MWGPRFHVTGVGRACGLDEEQMYLIMRHRSVFDPLPHNVHFAGAQPDRLIMQLDVKGPLEHKEQSSVSSWLMPDERTAEFDDHDVVPIELADGSRRPVVAEARELVLQVDGGKL